jgi:hypothetical protein
MDEDNKQGDEANHRRDDGHDNMTLERMIKRGDKNMKKSENVKMRMRMANRKVG